MTANVRPRLLLGCLLAVACAPPSSFNAVDAWTGRSVFVSLTPLRPGQSFSGKYMSPQAGTLDLKQNGNDIAGTWENRVCGCKIAGFLAGSIADNRARFTFTETHTGCKESRQLQGNGFLFYQSYAHRGARPELYGSRTYTSRPVVSYAIRYPPTTGVSEVLTARALTGNEEPDSNPCL